jgi:hypothetical protein
MYIILLFILHFVKKKKNDPIYQGEGAKNEWLTLGIF